MDTLVYRVELHCQTVEARKMGDTNVNVVAGIGNVHSTAYGVRCPVGAAVVQIRGEADDLVHSVHLGCRTL